MCHALDMTRQKRNQFSRLHKLFDGLMSKINTDKSTDALVSKQVTCAQAPLIKGAYKLKSQLIKVSSSPKYMTSNLSLLVSPLTK